VKDIYAYDDSNDSDDDEDSNYDDGYDDNYSDDNNDSEEGNFYVKAEYKTHSKI
jgi:hypothetical protein